MPPRPPRRFRDPARLRRRRLGGAHGLDPVGLLPVFTGWSRSSASTVPNGADRGGRARSSPGRGALLGRLAQPPGGDVGPGRRELRRVQRAGRWRARGMAARFFYEDMGTVPDGRAIRRRDPLVDEPRRSAAAPRPSCRRPSRGLPGCPRRARRPRAAGGLAGVIDAGPWSVPWRALNCSGSSRPARRGRARRAPLDSP